MAAIAPSLTWPLFIPYIADYFIDDVSMTSTELQADSLFVMSIVIAAIMDPLIAYVLRKVDCKVVVVFGYSLLIGSTVLAMLVKNLKAFVIVLGTMGQIGSSIILVSSLIILWEWYTPVSRGLVSGIGIGLQLVLSSAVLFAQQ
jgi:hypothetical protein